MTNNETQERFEEVNLELYRRVEKEFAEFKLKLLGESPEEILKNAYEFTIKEDILFSLEENNICTRDAETLLKREHPLDDIYQKHEHMGSKHMEEVYDAIECCAHQLEREEFIRQRRSKEQER